LVALGLLISILFDVIKHQRLMTTAQKRVSFGYTTATLIGVMISFFFPKILSISFTISIALLLGYLSLQSPSDTLDESTDTGNRAGFKQAMAAYFTQHNSFTLVCIEYDNISYFAKILGPAPMDEAIGILADRLKSVVPKHVIYRYDWNRFVLLLQHKPEQLDPIINKINSLSAEPIEILGTKIRLNPFICVLHSPESISYVDDVDDAIDFGIKECKRQAEPLPYYNLEEQAIIRKRRDQAILRILNRAINNDEFNVMYQPVKSSADGSFSSAEALARLNDQTLGEISPAEFIPLSETSGMVVKIGEIIIDHVCRFIKENIKVSSDRFNISINLSPVQCMQTDFADRVLDIVTLYDIDPRYLSFELTADTMEHLSSYFLSSMTKLSDLGVRFTIDNYTVNMEDAPYLTKAPLTSIKISKRITKRLAENKQLASSMKNSVSSLKDLGYRVIATGIETAEVADNFKSFGCDYLQGFYYSTPLSEADFAKFISENNSDEKK